MNQDKPGQDDNTMNDYDEEQDQNAEATEGSFKEATPTSQEELDELDPEHREGDELDEEEQRRVRGES